MKQQSAFTLIEALIGLFLSLLIISAVYELFSSQSRLFAYLQALARIEENAQLSTRLLGDAIRGAGYIGCLKNKEPMIFTAQTKLKARLSSAMQKRLQPQSDLLMLQGMAMQTVDVLTDMQDHHYLKISFKSRIKPGMMMLISDCEKKNLFQIEGINHSGRNVVLKSKQRLPIYLRGAQAGLWQELLFFIASTLREDMNHQSIYSLYLQDVNGRVEELVEGVSEMHVDDGAQIQLSLLLQSINNVYIKPQLYIYLGQRFYPKDRLMHKQWIINATIRQQ